MAETARYFEISRGIPNGWQPGHRIEVKNFREPLPTSLEWLRQHARPCDKPAAGAEMSVIDVQQVWADERAANTPAPPPKGVLTKEQLWKKLPWTRNAQKFDRAMAGLKFPPPIPRTDPTNQGSVAISFFVWSEAAIDKWLADQRETIALLREFVGE